MLEDQLQLEIKNGEILHIDVLKCPLDEALGEKIIRFLHEAFGYEDFSLSRATKGEFEDTSSNYFFIGYINGKMVSSCWYIVSKRNPEVGGYGEVFTEPEHRSKGIALVMTNIAMSHFGEHGGQAMYLGTGNPIAYRVYERAGFSTYMGAVMRYLKEQNENYDESYFEYSGHPTLRQAVWGDLAGAVALCAHPHKWLITDYRLQRFSSRYVPQQKCIGLFHPLWAAMEHDGGYLGIMENPNGRIVGEANLAPSKFPLQAHTAILDFLVHENYWSHSPALLEHVLVQAKRIGCGIVRTYLSSFDKEKIDSIRQVGFSLDATISGQYQLDNKQYDLQVYSYRIYV